MTALANGIENPIGKQALQQCSALLYQAVTEMQEQAAAPEEPPAEPPAE